MTFPSARQLGLTALFRSLRMRLTVSYVVFFALVLAGAGMLFERALDSMLQRPSRLMLQDFVRTYFLALPPMLLIICLVGWWLARRALAPLEELAAAASAVSGGTLDLRLAEHGTGDELDALIRTFNNMLERLERSFAQMSQFSLDASHELRTPLTAARGQLEVALLSGGTVEEHREAIGVAVQELERLSQLVDSLLLLAQAESRQLKLQFKRHNLAALVENVLSQYHVAAVDKGVRLESEMPKSDCYALVDRPEFERMLSKLVSNAVRCTPAGGAVRLELAYGAGTPGDIRLSVSDTGPGIAPEHQPRVFDRLYKVREGPPGADSGLGLGLSFAQWAAQAHGGRIELKSTAGKGATFTIVLPAAALAEAPAPSDETGDATVPVKEVQS